MQPVAPPDARPHPLDHLATRGAAHDTALILRDRILRYADLDARVGALAAWLAARFAAGSRVATWAGKGELTCLMPLAAARAGLVHVPINPLLKRAQVSYILHDCEAALLAANEARRSTLAGEDIPASCDTIAEPVLWQAVEEAGSYLPPSTRDPEQLCAILYTSGSTGLPKGVMLSHRNLWLGAVSVAHYLQLAADDVTLAALPLSFDYGQNQLLSTWYAGGVVVPLDYLVPKDVVKACDRHSVTTLAAVPPLWVQLVEVDWPASSIAALRRVTNSGGALTRPLVAAMKRTFPHADIVPMYGLTEAFRSSYLPPDLVAQHPTSIGLPIPFAELLVVNEAGGAASAGEEGELVHCGPLVAQGYWRDPVRTAERFRPAPAWSKHGGIAVYSGDRVRRDADGLLYFVGRRDGMIKSAGNRVSPDEIEEAAMASGLLSEAVALGVPDERLGQAVHLAVRGAGGASGETRERLQQHLARELPTFMQPRVVHWLDALPRNANGKFDRAALLAHLTAIEEAEL